MGLFTGLREAHYVSEVNELFEKRLKAAILENELSTDRISVDIVQAGAAGEAVGEIVSQLIGNTFIAVFNNDSHQIKRLQRRVALYLNAAAHIRRRSLEYMDDGNRAAHPLVFRLGLALTSKGPDNFLDQITAHHVVQAAQEGKVMPFMCYVKHDEQMRSLASDICDGVQSADAELANDLRCLIQ